MHKRKAQAGGVLTDREKAIFGVAYGCSNKKVKALKLKAISFGYK